MLKLPKDLRLPLSLLANGEPVLRNIALMGLLTADIPENLTYDDTTVFEKEPS